MLFFILQILQVLRMVVIAFRLGLADRLGRVLSMPVVFFGPLTAQVPRIIMMTLGHRFTDFLGPFGPQLGRFAEEGVERNLRLRYPTTHCNHSFSVWLQSSITT